MTGTTSPDGAATATPMLIRLFTTISLSPHDELSRGFSLRESATACSTNARYVRLTPNLIHTSSRTASLRRTRPVTSVSQTPHACGIREELLTMLSAIDSPHGAERHPLLVSVMGRRGLLRDGVDVRLHVGASDAALYAGARDLGEVHVMLLCKPSHGGRVARGRRGWG